MNYLILALVLALVAWMIGVANHGARGPLALVRDVWTSVVSGRTSRRSEGMSDDDEDTEDMSGHDVQEHADGALVVSREGRTGWGPRPELAHLAGRDDPADDEPVEADAAARRAWVRAQLARKPRLPLGVIDQDGARRFGVTPKTIWRDRRDLAADARARQS